MTCIICNRPLKDPHSIEIGMGPVCASKNHRLEGEDDPNPDDIILPYVMGEDIAIERTANGGVRCNVPRSIVRHSPTGYNFGYGGSGPADLALNIMLLFKDKELVRYYQDFKEQFIVPMDQEKGGIIKYDAIMKFIESKQNISPD